MQIQFEKNVDIAFEAGEAITALYGLKRMPKVRVKPKPASLKFSNLSNTGAIDPSKVRFSQNNIKGTFKDGRSVSDLTKGLKRWHYRS